MPALTLATVGGKIAAALINQIVNVLTVPQSYTPTISNWSSASTAPTTTARYWRSGSTGHVMVVSKLGTGTISVGAITVTVPPSMPIDTTGMNLLSTPPIARVSFRDVSVPSLFYGEARVIDANTIELLRYASSTPGQVSSTSSTTPLTWATLDEFSVLFSYPLA